MRKSLPTFIVPERLRTLLPVAVLAATGLLAAAISWFRWPNLLVDYGRELYVPWRIGAGEMLYADIPHLYGPLAQYLNALLFGCFGTGLRTLVAFNLLLVAALTAGVYRIVRPCGRLAATLCGMTFLGVFACARTVSDGSWNFVCPYSHEVTYGIALFFALVPAVAGFLERGGRLRAAAVGVLLGLVFLTKVEVFLAAFLATAVVVGLPALRSRCAGRAGREAALAALAGFAAPLACFVALFATRVTWGAAAGMVGATVTSLGRASIVGSPLYRMISGLDAPGAQAVVLLRGLAVYAALLAGVLVVSRHTGRRGGAGRNRLLLAAAVLALAAAAWFFRDRQGWWVQVAGRPLPLFVLAAAVHLVRRSAGARAGGRFVPLAMLSVFGGLLLAKILLRVAYSRYGFALAMPATLVVVAVAVSYLPVWVRRRGGCAQTARVLLTTLVVLFVALQIEVSRGVYARVNYTVGRGADAFLTHDPEVSESGPVVNEALGVIEATVAPDAGFVVIPEGVMLNYLARRRNPGRWFEFTPPFVASIGEARMRDDLEAGRPDYVVLTERSTAEHGPRYFGTDYGLILKAWIMERYAPVHLAGSKVFSNRGFGIVIARRKTTLP